MLTPYVTKYHTQESRAVVDSDRARLLQEYHANCVANAFYHSYRISGEDAEHLQQCFPNQYILVKKGRAIDCSHPVLGVLNAYANDMFKRQIEEDNRQGITTLTIGDAAHAPLRARHNCLLLDNPRDCSRVVNTHDADYTLRDHAFRRAPTPACTNGAQNCDYEAKHIYAVHSMYDVSMRDVAAIFKRHNTVRMLVALYIPPQFYGEHLNNIYPFFRTRQDGSHLFFSMGDFSTPYRHTVKTWRDWATTAAVRVDDDFVITIEHVRTHGPLHIIHLTRVSYFPTESYYISIPLTRMFPHMYLVPDVYQSMVNSFAYPQKQLRHYLVPENVVLAISAYANRTADAAYSFQEMATYTSGLRRNIVIGGTTYQESWQCGPQEYYRVLFSLFVLGAVQRTDRTTGISRTFKFLKDHYGGPSCWLGFKQMFHRVFMKLKDCPIDSAGEQLWDYQCVPLEDYVIRHVEHAQLRYLAPHYNPATIEDYTPEEQECEDDDDITSTSSIETATVCPGQDLDDPDGIEDRIETFLCTDCDIDKLSADISCVARIGVNATVLQPAMLPDTFIAGHSAMQAFYEAVKREPCLHIAAPSSPTDIFHHSVYLLACSGKVTPKQIAEYVYRGVVNDCTLYVIDLLAQQWHFAVRYHVRGAAPFVAGDDKWPIINIYHNGVNGPAGHYSSKPQGGNEVDLTDLFREVDAQPIIATAKVKPKKTASSSKGVTKFTNIISTIGVAGRVLDISAAPGDFSNLCMADKKIQLTCGYYRGDGRLPMRYKIPNFSYDHIDELKVAVGNRVFDCIFNDIGRPIDSETVIDEANELFVNQLSPGGILVTKSFGNGHAVFDLYARHFATIEAQNFNVKNRVTTERYFILRGFQRDVYADNAKRFYQAYDLYNRDTTVHKLPVPDDMDTFVAEYFDGMEQYKPAFRAMHDTFDISVISGVASASKSTRAYDRYARYIFIAPTKELAMRHQKSGVQSYTPHAVFKVDVRKVKGIVVDELSQFPLHYFALLHCYFNVDIIVLGDVNQTPFVNYKSKRVYPTLSKYGITNNILDAYKIPQDVAKLLNDRHQYRIRTHSTIVDALVYFRGDIVQFAASKIPVIAFNDATVKDLAAKGLNAHTITTYTGSRDHTVVFYIDSASVASQIVNKSEWIYTAMTRATNQLVIAGDCDYLGKIYAIHGTVFKSYEEISQIYIGHDAKPVREMSLPVTIPTEVAKVEASAETACAILESVIAPVNDPRNEFLLATNPVLPKVESGQLRTDLDTAANPDTSTIAYKVSLHKFVKNQVSNSTEQTLATLVKRYSKKYKQPMNKRNLEVSYTALCNGLSKAIYGNPHNFRKLQADLRVPHEYLVTHAVDYLQKLHDKVQANPSALRELGVAFDDLQEAIGFFNKRQCKFDPKIGFDTSDKVGQGVAATSKRVNIIFSAYARVLLDRIRELLLLNKRNIVLATHDSEAGLNDHFTRFMTEFKPPYKWSSNDFSEWDASFRKPFQTLTGHLIKCVGCPPEVADWFVKYRESWTMLYHCRFGVTTLRGQEKQFSGNPFTIAENTIGNMALCFALFDYKNFRFALFKGDDSCVMCDRCIRTKQADDILEILGHGLKLHNSDVGEFAGWFLTPEGLFPDVVRYSAKFLDKNYRDEKHFLEARMSLQERLSAVKTESQVRYGVAMCTQFYRENYPDLMGDLNQHAVHNLYAFIRGSRNIEFHHLRQVSLPNLNSN